MARLAGVWEGKRGVDINPKAEGPEKDPYIERYESIQLMVKPMVRNSIMDYVITPILYNQAKWKPSTIKWVLVMGT